MNERVPGPKVIGGTAAEKQQIGEFIQGKRVERWNSSTEKIYLNQLLKKFR